jgi:hypothetical protein
MKVVKLAFLPHMPAVLACDGRCSRVNHLFVYAEGVLDLVTTVDND